MQPEISPLWTFGSNIFTYGNRYVAGTLINNVGETINAQDGF